MDLFVVLYAAVWTLVERTLATADVLVRRVSRRIADIWSKIL
jgi:hypothetical protein